MSDIFREVDEDIRKDQLERLWKRIGPLVIAGAVLIVLATAGYTFWNNWQAQREQERTAILISALEAGQKDGVTPEAALKAVEDAAARLEGDHRTLAELYQAGGLIRSGRKAEAVQVLDRISGTAGDKLLRDLATLLSVMHQMDDGDPAMLKGRLAGLTTPDNTFQWSARELTGLLMVRNGDRAGASTQFRALADDPKAPAALRERAAELAGVTAVTN